MSGFTSAVRGGHRVAIVALLSSLLFAPSVFAEEAASSAEDAAPSAEEGTPPEGHEPLTSPDDEAHDAPQPETPTPLESVEVSSEEDAADSSQLGDGADAQRDECRCDCDTDDAESPTYILEAIEITGNRRTRERVILRELSLEPGQVLDLDDPAIDLARYRLLATGFFNVVDLRLRRGSRPGSVVMVVEVEERWTMVVREIFLGVSEITPYGGLHLDEMNLFGLGISLSGAFVAGREQQAYRLRLDVPRFLDSPVGLDFEFLYNDAQDYLGSSPVFVPPDRQVSYALIDYTRIGGAVGTGVRIGHNLNLYVDYRLELLRSDYPFAAAETDPTLGIRQSIDFHNLRGRSILSALSLSLDWDTRDHPFLPTRGHRVALTTTVASDVIGSHYHYFKLTLQADFYLRFRWRHSLHFRLLVGTIFGEAPLHELYFIGDLSDQNHARVLGLNFSHAPPPNLFRNSIEEMRYETLAGRFDVEYIVPLYQGRRIVYRLDFFLLLGLYSIGSAEHFQSPPAGYTGGPFPIDLTLDVGFRLDTTAGVFGFSFKTLLGLIPFSED
jgi:outer membrane protein insertion porin family